MGEVNNTFSVVVYENLTPYSDTLSKSRCRIFYKGANRNGTYITEEFANQLLSTIAYAPIKGIYDHYEEDYTDHGNSRTLGRIYGVVPENCNLRWEDHLDEDGIARTYACVDVLIYTGLYEEADKIVGKAQSMELYPPSINGDWRIVDGKEYFFFTSAKFLGLQILGNGTEPCFEGASFFSLLEDLKNYNSNKNKKEEEAMKPIFKLSNSEECKALWDTLNPNFTEEKNWEYKYEIIDVFDGFVFVYNKEEQKFENIHYTNEEGELILGEATEVFALGVTKEEQESLEAFKALNNNTYTNVETIYSSIDTYKNSILEKEQKIEELVEENSTLTQSKEDLTQKLSELTATYTALKEEKEISDNRQKEELLKKFSSKLSEEIINTYTTKIAEYSYEDLKKALALEYVDNTPSFFSMDDDTKFIPKQEPLQGIEAILEQYK